MFANTLFALSAVLSGLILALHVFVGGPAIARPMRESPALEPVVRLTNYYCWHLVSIALAQMTFLYAWAALHPQAAILAAIATATAFAFCIWGVVLVAKTKQAFGDMPQGFLFLTVAVFGLIGLLV